MDTDDVGIPIFFAKTKLKTLNFATNITSIFKNFDDNETKTINFSKPISFINSIDDQKENKNINNKRTRTESLNESIDLNDNGKKETNKKICVDKTEQKTDENKQEKPKKTSFNDNNFRRLNMKTFRSKGKNGGSNLKGSKYKKFLWMKNKNKNKINAKYGVGVRHDDDDNDTFNYNLICDDSPTKSKKEEEEKEIIDEQSAEAIFARLKKPVENEKKRNNKETNQKKTEIENHESVDSKLEKIIKKSKSTNKKEKKTILKKINNSEELDDAEAIEKNEKDLEKSSKKNSKSAKQKNSKTKIDDQKENEEKYVSQTEIADEDDYLLNTDLSESDTIKPLFSVDEEGNVPTKLPNYAYKILEKDFGHKKFKKNQEETIIRIACGQSSLAILSTGYGKSLIYQFAALLYAKKYPGAVVLVVSPLISLMQDQLHNLTKSLKAAACDSQMSDKEFEQLVQNLNDGKINILYMSPEAIINKKIKKIPRLAFVCIDEVHCLSQWSHNFRPSYLQLCQILFGFYNAKCILGLTATATEGTVEEIRSYFDIHKRNIIKDCDLPENLVISVSKDNNKEKALVDLLKSEKFKPFFDHVIIYCSRREQTERLSQLLRLSLQTYKKKYDLEKYATMERKPKGMTGKSKSLKITDDEESDNNIAEAYHAGLSAQQRKRIQNQFIKGKLKIIVATLAFGMGINMPNIRAVIHYNMPKSIENYVQEIGRAGRDGKNSLCYLFLETQREDINEIKKYIHMNGYDQLTIKKLLLKIFDCCDKDNCKNENQEYKHHVALPISEMVDYLDVKEETILTLLCYLESAKYVKILSNCFKTCTIKSYKGIDYLNQLAKTNEFVALILKQNKNLKSSLDESLSEIKVDLIELCDLTNGEYDVIRQKLKRIEWQLDDVGNYKSKSGINVQFHEPSFYVKRRCILDENELDTLNDLLWNRVDTQMKFSYSNFKSLYKMLSEHSYNSIDQFIDCFEILNEKNEHQSKTDIITSNFEDENETEKDKKEIEEEEEEKIQDNKNTSSESHLLTSSLSSETLANININKDQVTFKSKLLKQKLNKYFNNQFDMNEYTKDYDFDCENQSNKITREQELKRLIADIRKFIFTYNSEIKLNGLIIARIFHGIGTPRFPNEIWARNRLFWRCHLDFDFENIIKIATEQLLNL